VTDRKTIHLHPTAPLAERVLLPGDPGRALLLAQKLLESPAMFNHNRGLWGYTGTAADGLPLTIQSTGIGGPSAAIVIAELADLGAGRLLRVGTCGALNPALALGDLIVVTEAISADGTSRSLGAEGRVSPDPDLVAALITAGGERVQSGPVVSTDLFYDGPAGEEREWIEAGAVAVEMETATLFALARRRHLRAACLLLVSDLLIPSQPDDSRSALSGEAGCRARRKRERMAADDLPAGEERLGAVAVRALAQAAISL
jgi:DeoD family purine-nucleoside phosphorylase